MPVLLVRDSPCDRLEVCFGVNEAQEEEFRPGTLLPVGDWRVAAGSKRIAWSTTMTISLCTKT